jgi:hypothetical protein
MKAIVYTKYGPPDVLQLKEVEKPTSGQPSIKLEVESMGRSITLITEINERVVVLNCFGEPAPVSMTKTIE